MFLQNATMIKFTSGKIVEARMHAREHILISNLPAQCGDLVHDKQAYLGRSVTAVKQK